MEIQLMGQEIVPATFTAVDTANLTYKFIAITTSKLQANHAIRPKRYAEHLQQIAGGYYQVDKNTNICLAAIYQARSKPAIEDTNSPRRSQSRWHRRSHEGIEQSSGGNR
tara:strand:- start:24 stop:353 length:330 start_codon:yes stop_codon:yes gene_type:complete